MSASLFVAWINIFVPGTFVPYIVRVKLVPMPNTTSAAFRNCIMCSGLVIADAPSDSGCCSGNALLPGIVVVTGMSSISAKRTSSALASANNTPCPANTTGCFAASSASTASRTAV